jgi:hypothetical protein
MYNKKKNTDIPEELRAKAETYLNDVRKKIVRDFYTFAESLRQQQTE